MWMTSESLFTVFVFVCLFVCCVLLVVTGVLVCVFVVCGLWFVCVYDVVCCLLLLCV